MNLKSWITTPDVAAPTGPYDYSATLLYLQLDDMYRAAKAFIVQGVAVQDAERLIEILWIVDEVAREARPDAVLRQFREETVAICERMAAAAAALAEPVLEGAELRRAIQRTIPLQPLHNRALHMEAFQ